MHHPMSAHPHPVPSPGVNIHWARSWPWPGVRPGHPDSIARLINDLCSAPASSNARNYTQWATQTTFINVEFFNSIFLRYWMIYDLSHSLSLVASLPRCCLGRCHPSADDTGWQLDMITNNLPEQSGPQTPGGSWNQWKPISNLLLACYSDTVISENKS